MKKYRNPAIKAAAIKYQTMKQYGALKQIACEFGVTPHSVCAYIRRGGLKKA